MGKNIKHLPPYKQEELDIIVSTINEFATVEMIILFGSHARGDQEEKEWVKHKYIKENIIYEYGSDFDILIIVENKIMEEDFGIWNKIETEIYKKGVKTWVSIIIDNIDYVNEQIKLGRYFYSDIKKEGIILYDSKNYKLTKSHKLSKEKQKELAEKDFKYWFNSATFFYDDYESNMEKKRYANSAFNLHQSTERFLTALMLTYTGYRPKTHDLKKLLERCKNIAPEIEMIFFERIEIEKEFKLFELLRKAYVDARYENNYKINENELKILAKKVELLKKTVKELYEKKIKTL